MPDLNGIDPTIFSVASSMIQNLSGYVPTISVPLPATTLCLSAASTVTHKATSASPIDAKRAGRRRESMAVIVKRSSGEHEVELAPVLLGRGTLAGPVRRVIELVRHLGRPVAADMAIEQIPFDRLAQSGGPAGAVRFPTGRKHERAADREVRSCAAGGLLWRPLQGHDVALRGALHTLRLAVHSLEMLHASSPQLTRSAAIGSSNCARNAGFLSESSP